jgi:hypothetical protein
MGDDPKAVDNALAVVQRTLDSLLAGGAAGKHAAAFEIARAQFSASIRASWPANLAGVASAIERALADAELDLSATERQDLSGAVKVLRAVSHG